MKYLALMMILYASTTVTELLKVGANIPLISLKDQHGETHTVGRDARLIMFCKDRKGQDIISEALDKKRADYLTEQNTVYIADTSGIPRLVAKFIAFPTLRKKPYTVLLDNEPSLTKVFPTKKDCVTLLHMNAFVIQSIEFVDDPELILKAIDSTKQQAVK